MVQAASILGATAIIGVDPIASRRQTARGLGATLNVEPG